ncbi:MAG: ABC transporter permease [Oscillospiraceae bacterium]|nr:ABC transporter permease [Oscillospiraceae bacterium]
MTFKEFVRRFSRHRLALISFFIIIIELLLVCFGPPILDLDPTTIDKTAFSAAPSEAHPLGTDSSGRDVLARLFYGGRMSLLVGVAATAVSVLVGLPLGLIAGFYRGKLEGIIMRASDITQSFPSIVLTLVLVAVFGSSVPLLITIIGVLHWPAVGKLIYGNALSVRSKEYVEAERTIGTNDFKLLFCTVLPNCIAPLWVSLAFRISASMLTESSLSFLGAGIRPPMASWGNIIQEASSLAVLTNRWWIWVPAGICLVVTIVCLNFVGEGIRDALDPKMKRI